MAPTAQPAEPSPALFEIMSSPPHGPAGSLAAASGSEERRGVSRASARGERAAPKGPYAEQGDPSWESSAFGGGSCSFRRRRAALNTMPLLSPVSGLRAVPGLPLPMNTRAGMEWDRQRMVVSQSRRRCGHACYSCKCALSSCMAEPVLDSGAPQGPQHGPSTVCIVTS